MLPLRENTDHTARLSSIPWVVRGGCQLSNAHTDHQRRSRITSHFESEVLGFTGPLTSVTLASQ
jgi:hypothetical protein